MSFSHLLKRNLAAAVLSVALVLAGTAVADARESDDLIEWIASSCRARPDLSTLMRVDQVASKAIPDLLRMRRYEDASLLALEHLKCLEAAGAGIGEVVFEARLASLRQLVCFVPLIAFEHRRRVDPDLASRALEGCIAPLMEPPGKDAGSVRRWAEDIRRYLHLVAAARQPGELLESAKAYLDAFGKAGLVGEDGDTLWPGIGKDTDDQSGDTPDAETDASPLEGAPDPVFGTRVLVVGGAIATGSVDDLLAVSGGREKACESPFLAALGFLQTMKLPRESALPLVLQAVVGRASLDTLVAGAEAAAAAYPNRCMPELLAASLALAGLGGTGVDRAVGEGRIDLLVRLVRRVPAVMAVPGSAVSRATVLEKVLEDLEGTGRGRRYCELGDARLELGQAVGALGAFRVASSELAQDEKDCATKGILRAMLSGVGDAASPDEVLEAARAFLAGKPSAARVFAVIRTPEGEPGRADAVRLMGRAATGMDDGGSDAVFEAVVKVVDQEPGTDSARAAVKVVEDAGWPRDKADAPFWRFVQTRHHLVAKETAAARKALADGFRIASPDQEGLAEGVGTLMRWMALEKHYRILDDTLRMARKAGLTRLRELASVASFLGDAGERARARSILASARALGPESPDDWVGLADAYARIDDVKRAQECLERVGPRESWGSDPWMIVGRIESSRKRYRESVAAYEKAMELSEERLAAIYFRGLSLLLLGDPEGAEADFRTSIEMGNKDPQVLGALGYALFDQSRLDDAEEAFRQAVELDDDAPDNHLGLAMTLLRADRVQDAMASYSRVLALDKDFNRGIRVVERKGFVYSDIQAKAWEDLRARHRKVRKP